MMKARPIELLAPAKELTCGLEAVRHGADAVYIGAPRFGARAAAGNSVDDIRTLCDYAHLYDVRVYVALNTILKDEELQEAETLIRQLYDAGADALIIQDMGITQLDIPPIPLHASTQTDNCTPEKVEFLHRIGFTQIVLARELTLEEIQTIAERVPDAALETFVHGALCVSDSGRCYLSAALSGRSANRGACAQYCRLPYVLIDADDRTILEKKHLLSLKDLNRADELEALLQAGVSSLKIEGRLKEVSYVKNIVAYYRQRLDKIFAKNPAYYRPSAGHSSYTFEPQPEKSFNRGFTTYFLHGRDAEITSFDTPKSIGELVGTVKEIKGNTFTVAGLKPIHNGDGLAFFNAHGELEGFRVNRVEANRVFPQVMPLLRPKMPLYRNYDHAFESQLTKPSAERKIGVNIEWIDSPEGFMLTIEAPDLCGSDIYPADQSPDTNNLAIGRFDLADEQIFTSGVTVARPFAKEIARKPQDENIRTQLGKLGNTPFYAAEIRISMTKNYFVPSSILSEMRREATERLIAKRLNFYYHDNQNGYHPHNRSSNRYDCRRYHATPPACDHSDTPPMPYSMTPPLLHPVLYPVQNLDYTANVANQKAIGFYKKHGVKTIAPAFETEPPPDVPLMYTKHCLRYSMGWCPVLQKNKSPFREPFFLTYKDVKLRLSFDCLHCRMLIYKQ